MAFYDVYIDLPEFTKRAGEGMKEKKGRKETHMVDHGSEGGIVDVRSLLFHCVGVLAECSLSAAFPGFAVAWSWLLSATAPRAFTPVTCNMPSKCQG